MAKKHLHYVIKYDAQPIFDALDSLRASFTKLGQRIAFRKYLSTSMAPAPFVGSVDI